MRKESSVGEALAGPPLKTLVILPSFCQEVQLTVAITNYCNRRTAHSNGIVRRSATKSQILPGLPLVSSGAFSRNYNLDSAAVRPAPAVAAESSTTAPTMW